MMERLFVYGTLRQRSPNSRADLLAGAARYIDRGRMRGRLVDLGEYPGLVPAHGKDEWVRGEVFMLSSPAALLARLDRYEGCTMGGRNTTGFRRIKDRVVLDSGRTVRAWVYVYQGPVGRGAVIASGDYLTELVREQPES